MECLNSFKGCGVCVYIWLQILLFIQPCHSKYERWTKMFALASVNSKNEVNTKSEHIRLLFFSMFSRERWYRCWCWYYYLERKKYFFYWHCNSTHTHTQERKRVILMRDKGQCAHSYNFASAFANCFKTKHNALLFSHLLTLFHILYISIFFFLRSSVLLSSSFASNAILASLFRAHYVPLFSSLHSFFSHCVCALIRATALILWLSWVRERWCLCVDAAEMHERIQWTKECQCVNRCTRIFKTVAIHLSEWMSERGPKTTEFKCMKTEEEAAAVEMNESSTLVFIKGRNMKTNFYALISIYARSILFSVSLPHTLPCLVSVHCTVCVFG